MVISIPFYYDDHTAPGRVGQAVEKREHPAVGTATGGATAGGCQYKERKI